MADTDSLFQGKDSAFDSANLLSNDIAFIYDIQKGEYTFVSPSIERFTGKPATHFANTDFQYLLFNIHPDDVDKIVESKERAFRSKLNPAYSSVEFRFRIYDGQWAWFKADYIIESDGDGVPSTARGAARYIDKEKRLELRTDALLERDALLNKMLDSGIFEVDLRDNTATPSAEFQRKLGILKPKAKVPLQEIYQSLHQEDLKHLLSAVKTLISRGEGLLIFEFRIDIKGKGYCWYKARFAISERAPGGRPVKLLGITAELHSPPGANSIAANSLMNILALFERYTVGLVIINELGRIEAVNQKTENLTKIDRKEILGKPLWSVIYNVLPYELKDTFSIEIYTKKINQYLISGESEYNGKEMEVEIQRGDGAQVKLNVRAQSIQVEKVYNLALIIKEKS